MVVSSRKVGWVLLILGFFSLGVVKSTNFLPEIACGTGGVAFTGFCSNIIFGRHGTCRTNECDQGSPACVSDGASCNLQTNSKSGFCQQTISDLSNILCCVTSCDCDQGWEGTQCTIPQCSGISTSQLSPRNPNVQLHSFGESQVPWAEQTRGSVALRPQHNGKSQSTPENPRIQESQLSPVNCELQEHVSGEVQVPWAEQTRGSVAFLPQHNGTSQSTPENPEMQESQLSPVNCELQEQVFGEVHVP